MDLYRVLLVDDEPYIVECVENLLEEQSKLSIEAYRAYTANQALRILNERKIDIMIADIQMPGLSGLKLARVVRDRWPACRVILLTAHAEFEYAREAMQADVSEYVLKTDSDSVILEAFHNCARNLERDFKRLDFLSMGRAPRKHDVLYSNALLSMLKNRREAHSATNKQLLEALGCARWDMELRLVAGLCGRAEELKDMSEPLMDAASRFACCAPDGDAAVWLVQIAEGETASEFETWLIGTFETLSQHAEVALSIRSRFYIGRALTDPGRIAYEYERMRALALSSACEAGAVKLIRREDEPAGFDKAIRDIESYIELNIAGDVSLSALSSAIGYNASYLSRMYLARTGKHISVYVTERRLAHIKGLMRDPKLTLNDISRRAGFETQSYFNRFIRRATGLTPGQLRENGE